LDSAYDGTVDIVNTLVIHKISELYGDIV